MPSPPETAQTPRAFFRTRTDGTQHHRRGFFPLWTTLSGFESLPPSHFPISAFFLNNFARFNTKSTGVTFSSVILTVSAKRSRRTLDRHPSRASARSVIKITCTIAGGQESGPQPGRPGRRFLEFHNGFDGTSAGGSVAARSRTQSIYLARADRRTPLPSVRNRNSAGYEGSQSAGHFLRRQRSRGYASTSRG